MTHARYSWTDKLCLGIDQAVRALADNVKTTSRPYPADTLPKSELAILDPTQQKQAAALMRINHAGEICAQALYHGQGLASRNYHVQEKMREAAIEEGDHLAWCKRRLDDLGSHTSYLNPLWYSGSFMIGALAGLLGDRWSLGFVAETECQVVNHLQNHLQALPAEDKQSHLVLQQMQQDEAQHRDSAIQSGAQELPGWVKKLMTLTSKIMVKCAYWI